MISLKKATRSKGRRRKTNGTKELYPRVLRRLGCQRTTCFLKRGWTLTTPFFGLGVKHQDDGSRLFYLAKGSSGELDLATTIICHLRHYVAWNMTWHSPDSSSLKFFIPSRAKHPSLECHSYSFVLPAVISDALTVIPYTALKVERR